MLNLVEELFLLAIDDDRGVVHPSASTGLPYGMAGAILSELTFSGKLGLEGNKVVILENLVCNDEILDESLAKIVQAEKPRKATYWINVLSQHNKQLRSRVAASLVAMGALRKEGKRFLWVIPYEAYPQQDASAKYWVKQRLREAVLTQFQPEARTLGLLSLLHACGMLGLVFTKDERRRARKRIEELVQGEIIGEAVAQTLEEISAAAAAAALAAAT
ncbi:MAG: GPP34 family phosphoprotein [Chloroflexota bacterium]